MRSGLRCGCPRGQSSPPCGIHLNVDTSRHKETASSVIRKLAVTSAQNRGTMSHTFEDYVEVMRRLRAPDGCPWDREQTHQTIRPYVIEEAHEVAEAIDSEDWDGLKKELADLLLQILFHAQLAAEAGRFTIYDVIEAGITKIVGRHPHVFGDAVADTAEEVLRNWERMKLEEKGHEGRRSVLDGLPVALPALQRAARLQEKVARVGFQWSHWQGVFGKVREEIQELETDCSAQDGKAIERELGDALFALANLGLFFKLCPEAALTRANRRFESRFHYVEEALAKEGRTPQEATLDEMDALWDQAKEEE